MIETSDASGTSTIPGKAGTRDVQIAYNCSAVEDYESLEIIQDLIDSVVQRLLAKTRFSSDDRGPIRVRVEHCQKRRERDIPLSGVRYLKVYVEGHGPCIVMAY